MPSEKSAERIKAEQIYKDSKGAIKLVDIAGQLGVPPNKVRKWKSLDQWDKAPGSDASSSKKKQGERSTKDKGNAPPITVPQEKKRKGAPKGNQYAVGNNGGAPIGNQNAYKHGGYAAIYMDCLDEDEKALLELIPTDEEDLLLEQIQLYSIRERRLLRIINEMKQKAELVLSSVFRSEQKVDFPNTPEGKAERELYNELRKQKLDEEKISYFGNQYQLNTQTESKISVIQRLENELTRVQSAKTKAISELQKLREARRNASEGAAKSAAVDDWVSACMGDEGEEDD